MWRRFDVFKRIKFMRIFDGNSVFECSNNREHRFWKNSREEHGILHLNKHATQFLFHSDKDYVWNESVRA